MINPESRQQVFGLKSLPQNPATREIFSGGLRLMMILICNDGIIISCLGAAGVLLSGLVRECYGRLMKGQIFIKFAQAHLACD